MKRSLEFLVSKNILSAAIVALILVYFHHSYSAILVMIIGGTDFTRNRDYKATLDNKISESQKEISSIARECVFNETSSEPNVSTRMALMKQLGSKVSNLVALQKERENLK